MSCLNTIQGHYTKEEPREMRQNANLLLLELYFGMLAKKIINLLVNHLCHPYISTIQNLQLVLSLTPNLHLLLLLLLSKFNFEASMII